ncbi:PREDICTED: uncharacterized protein LOC105145307 [Acromyrmex echinatior]|uniref:uncharacterized protein LOC105145307 n=1 Tax=Acromyrmex echinatior TaxID=103372 RepID=UPI000580F8C7|nr:PREDICTED: uncharacterized protein LOC105145307 [Acromyrmex echinatior]XP_011053065.1 PREDICTED: uncharacterized protein LOC105145307 [Acromyrmex echinatior]
MAIAAAFHIEPEFLVDYAVVKRETMSERPEFVLFDVRARTHVRQFGSMDNFTNINDVNEIIENTEEEFQREYRIPKPREDTKMIISSYCFESGQAAVRRLRNVGYTQVFLYGEGIEDWNRNEEEESRRFKITYSDLLINQMDENVLIIDIRDVEEIAAKGAIPGSINIPSEKVNEAFNLSGIDFFNMYKIPKPTKDTKIILSCSSGNRSKCAQKQIRRLKYRQVFDFEGGWDEWNKKQLAARK